MSETNINLYIKALSDGKTYLGKAGNLELAENDEILFVYDQFEEVGRVVGTAGGEGSDEGSDNIVSVIRKLTAKDREIISEKKNEAKDLIPKCSEKIKKHDLEMDLLDADLSYDGKKLTFYFTAPGRVDFRALVPDLASTFKKLIRLQQVSSRDKAKCVDAIGRCGRGICCKNFLKENLENVTMDMVYEQNLGQMGSTRFIGVCGKLQCCLKYELEQYRKIRAKLPAIGADISTPEGKGTVVGQNLIKSCVTVELKKDKRMVEVSC